MGLGSLLFVSVFTCLLLPLYETFSYYYSFIFYFFLPRRAAQFPQSFRSFCLTPKCRELIMWEKEKGSAAPGSAFSTELECSEKK